MPISPSCRRLSALIGALVVVIAISQVVVADDATADWPTYLHNNGRTATSPITLTFPLSPAWVYQAPHPPRPAWPKPAKNDLWHKRFNLPPRVTYDRVYHVVSSEGRVFFGCSADDQVRCLDLKSGKVVWTFFAEGPVRLAPSISEGRVYFGSDDGHVYCVDAAGGKLIWKHRAAPEPRRIAGNGRIISAWPVRSDTMVDGDVVRLTAGIFPSQGTYQMVLDRRTGKLVATAPINISPQGYLVRRNDRLYFHNGRSGLAFASKAERRGVSTPARRNKKKDKTKVGPASRIIAGAHRFVGTDGAVKAVDTKTGKTVWSAKVEGSAGSLAVVQGNLLVSTDRGQVYCFRTGQTKDVAKTSDLQPTAQSRQPNDKQRSRATEIAQRALREAKVDRGYALVIGPHGDQIAAELARRSALQVVVFEPNPKQADEMRRTLARSGLYGRVAVHVGSPESLPYGDYLFNIAVIDLAGKKLDAKVILAEAMRVVRPDGGVALAVNHSGAASKPWSALKDNGTAIFRRPALPGAGEWSHLYADPANTVCSNDERIGTDVAIQWFGRPGPRKMVDRHHRAMSPLSVGGRLFVPGHNHLFAVDAYNGTILWERPIPNSVRIGVGRDCGNMVATNDVVYVAAGAKCVRFDSRSGKPLADLAIPAALDGKPREWGYLARLDKLLLGSATKPGASRRGYSLPLVHQIYKDNQSVVTSDSLFGIPDANRTEPWVYRPAGAIVNSTITAGAGRVYFIESTDAKSLEVANGRSPLRSLLAQPARLTALDANSGKQLWTQSVDLRPVQHDVSLVLAYDRLLLCGSGNFGKGKEARVKYYLSSYQADTGGPAWTREQQMPHKPGGFHGEQNKRLVIVGDRIYLDPVALQLSTGEPIKGWKLGSKKGCGMVSASRQAFYFRSRSCGACDLKSGKGGPITQITRPGCWINMIPAAGLLLIPEASSGCTCDFAIQTSMALVPRKATPKK